MEPTRHRPRSWASRLPLRNVDVSIVARHSQPEEPGLDALPLLNEHNLPHMLHFLLPGGKSEPSSRGEPWGLRLWIGAVVVVLIAFCVESYGITKWPMADDE